MARTPWKINLEEVLLSPNPLKVDLPRDQLVFLAELCELSERYDDMIQFMKSVVKLAPSQLSVLERNLLSIGYKNVIGARRASWRILCSLETKESEGRNNTVVLAAIQKYKTHVEHEIAAGCLDLISILDSVLIPNASDDVEAKASYLKMKADYHRYYAESAPGDEQKLLAETTYNDALALVMKMHVTHPVRLSLVLNFSVFTYEVLKQQDKGIHLAKTVCEQAEAHINSVEPEVRAEVSRILRLLRDNVNLWIEDTAQNPNS
eukprot:PhF_6_TR10113/c0_g1_i1/m.15727/K06630/YWHAE; 14-3-3 protein epsilon